MPDLDFQITGVNPAVHALTPLLQFTLRVTNRTPQENIEGVSLNVQIQIQCPQRTYHKAEKERLSELFGTPERWGETLRNRLWTQLSTTVRPFTDTVEAKLAVPCTYDLNVSTAKYFHALEGGDVGLLFLLSGTVFYRDVNRQIQIAQIPWNKECTYRMPVERWREVMAQHYPNSTWVNLHRDVFEQLYEYRRLHGLAHWDEAVARLLEAAAKDEAMHTINSDGEGVLV
jgi:hypothetical protein